MDCNACKQTIRYDNEILKCVGCLKKYHYACLNITSAYYLDNMFELKKSWKCPSCQNVTNRRARNDDTPVRKHYLGLNDTTMSVDGSIIEDTNKQNPTNYLDSSTVDTLDFTLEDNTMLAKISLLLDKKLEENKISILTEIKHALDDILNVDLTGYVEELTRIGRKNLPRRPIVIELTSKSMVKYLLQNSRFFRNTGLSISEYLDEAALQARKHLQLHLRAARNDGHHAIIRDNKLIIDGKIVHTYLQKLNSPLSLQTQSNSPSKHASRYTSPVSTIALSQQLAQEQDPTQNNTFRH
ncbi:hypothetical protein ACJJTC_005464 [Scirpophaga incertulas]